MNAPARDSRVRELSRWTKTRLASHFRRTTGYLGGQVPPERWSKDDLINEILRAEFPGLGF